MTTWATVDDVFRLTGVRADPDQVAQAQGVVDLYSGLTTANVDNVTARDGRLLKMATAYQAAFVASQVDVASRMGATSVQQDGASFTVGSVDDLVLAPLARRCLAGLSWRRPRTRTARRGPDYPRSFAAYSAAWNDDLAPGMWSCR